MIESLRKLRIVVASPSDVQDERDLLEEVAEELNKTTAGYHNLHIDIIRWETDAYPGFHIDGPQGLIDTILRIEECDLLIGIFWKRFGTPTLDAQSGTEHEFLKAYDAWKQNGRPQIMVYFNQQSYWPKKPAEVDQWKQVLEFKEKFPKEGLFWSYEGKVQFEKKVRRHLTDYILSIAKEQELTSQAKDVLLHFEHYSTNIASDELNRVINENQALRGFLLGYLAEFNLQKLLLSDNKISNVHKFNDHTGSKNYDLGVVYKGYDFTIKMKSLQTTRVKREGTKYVGQFLCDSTDRRSVSFPNGNRVETTCLVVGSFDIIAVNLFAFTGQWDFGFALGKELPRSRNAKYTDEQKKYLLATSIKITWPLEPPFVNDPFILLDQLVEAQL